MNKKDYCCYLYKLFSHYKEQLLIMSNEFQVITIYNKKLYFLYNGSKKLYLSQFGMDIYSVCINKNQILYDELLCLMLNKYHGYSNEIISKHFFQVILKLKKNGVLKGKRF